MDDGQKQRIIRQFLQEKIGAEQRVLMDDKALLRAYDEIGVCLDWIETDACDLFDLAVIHGDREKWRIFGNILNHACIFDEGSSPAVKTVSMSRLQERTAFWQRDLQLASFPGCDYYQRKVTIASDVALLNLVTLSQLKLQQIIQDILPPTFNINDKTAVKKKIKELRASVNKAPVGSRRLRAQQQLTILLDLQQITLLRQLNIPQEDDGDVAYCALVSSIAAVTTNVLLITCEKVVEQLTQLNLANITTPQSYSEQRHQFKLESQAILKLHQHGDVRDIQREAMGLNISRMLGLLTTDSTMVSYQGKPALFVPFDHELHGLSDVATGRTMQTRIFSTLPYPQCSTINPVGEGLQANRFIDDFGSSLGLFYLCSDTRAMGGYHQNNAIKRKSLFIVNQLVRIKDTLNLDSRLSMQPIGFFARFSQRGQGHHRTLVEDASIDSSFASIMQLKREQAKLAQYCARVASIHHGRLKDMSALYHATKVSQVRNALKKEMHIVRVLMNDAHKIKQKVDERIKKINDIMPSSRSDIDPELIKKTLVLELLLNKPILFADDGRPYRYPWTNRTINCVLYIVPSAQSEDYFIITFAKKIPEGVLAMLLQLCGSASLIRYSKKELLISRFALQALNETMLFPEQQDSFLAEKNYLVFTELDVIKKAYGKGHRRLVMKAIHTYQRVMLSDVLSIDSKLETMQATEATLMTYIAAAKDKGFGMHVLKKFHFDVQRQLQQLIQPSAVLLMQLTAAFNAALKLDQISQFNSAVLVAIKYKRLMDPQFLGFLDACIDMASTATDHVSATHQSVGLNILATRWKTCGATL